MGTSSTRTGRKGDPSWKRAKSNISKFFNGNASFETAVKSTIAAFGGSDNYFSDYRAKKNAAFGKLAGVVIGSINSDLRTSFEKIGYIHPELNTPEELLVGYVNDIFPNTNTPQDTLIREELLKEAYWYASCYDESLRLIEENAFIDNILFLHVKNVIVEEYVDVLEFESPYSVESDNVEEVMKNKTKAKDELRKLIDEFIGEYDGDKKDIKLMMSFLQNRLDIYFEFGGKR